MFIGLKNIDRIAEGMFFIFIFFFYRANIIDFHPLEELNGNKIFWNIEIRESFKDWRSIEQKLGEEIMQLFKDEDLKINRPIKRADVDSFSIKAKVLSELEFKTVV